MNKQNEKKWIDYFVVIISGSALLLSFEYLLVYFHLIHMFSILPTIFLSAGIIGLWIKRTGWSRYYQELDNGVILGLAIALLYGVVSVPLNFQRTSSDAILYILFSLGMTIASLFVLPVVLRMFIKRHKNMKAAKNK